MYIDNIRILENVAPLRNGEEIVDKINKVETQDESIRERHKEKVSLLQDIPLPGADDE